MAPKRNPTASGSRGEPDSRGGTTRRAPPYPPRGGAAPHPSGRSAPTRGAVEGAGGSARRAPAVRDDKALADAAAVALHSGAGGGGENDTRGDGGDCPEELVGAGEIVRGEEGGALGGMGVFGRDGVAGRDVVPDEQAVLGVGGVPDDGPVPDVFLRESPGPKGVSCESSGPRAILCESHAPDGGESAGTPSGATLLGTRETPPDVRALGASLQGLLIHAPAAAATRDYPATPAFPLADDHVRTTRGQAQDARVPASRGDSAGAASALFAAGFGGGAGSASSAGASTTSSRMTTRDGYLCQDSYCGLSGGDYEGDEETRQLVVDVGLRLIASFRGEAVSSANALRSWANSLLKKTALQEVVAMMGPRLIDKIVRLATRARNRDSGLERHLAEAALEGVDMREAFIGYLDLVHRHWEKPGATRLGPRMSPMAMPVKWRSSHGELYARFLSMGETPEDAKEASDGPRVVGPTDVWERAESAVDDADCTDRPSSAVEPTPAAEAPVRFGLPGVSESDLRPTTPPATLVQAGPRTSFGGLETGRRAIDRRISRDSADEVAKSGEILRRQARETEFDVPPRVVLPTAPNRNRVREQAVTSAARNSGVPSSLGHRRAFKNYCGIDPSHPDSDGNDGVGLKPTMDLPDYGSKFYDANVYGYRPSMIPPAATQLAPPRIVEPIAEAREVRSEAVVDFEPEDGDVFLSGKSAAPASQARQPGIVVPTESGTDEYDPSRSLRSGLAMDSATMDNLEMLLSRPCSQILVTSLLGSATELENPSLSHVRLHVDAVQRDQRETMRADAAGMSCSPIVDSLECLSGLVEDSNAGEVVQGLVRLSRIGVDVPTRAATARLFSSLLSSRGVVVEERDAKVMHAATAAARPKKNAHDNLARRLHVNGHKVDVGNKKEDNVDVAVEGLGEILSSLKRGEYEEPEHRFVVGNIEDRLEEAGPTVSVSSPKVIRLPRLLHLATDVQGGGGDRREDFTQTLLNATHPTPAVCGVPRAVTMERLRGLERLDCGSTPGRSGDGSGLTLDPAQVHAETSCGVLRAAFIRAQCPLYKDMVRVAKKWRDGTDFMVPGAAMGDYLVELLMVEAFHGAGAAEPSPDLYSSIFRRFLALIATQSGTGPEAIAADTMPTTFPVWTTCYNRATVDHCLARGLLEIDNADATRDGSALVIVDPAVPYVNVARTVTERGELRVAARESLAAFQSTEMVEILGVRLQTFSEKVFHRQGNGEQTGINSSRATAHEQPDSFLMHSKSLKSWKVWARMELKAGGTDAGRNLQRSRTSLRWRKGGRSTADPAKLRASDPETQALRRKLMRGSSILIIQGGYSGKRFIYERLHELGVHVTIMDGPDTVWRAAAEEGVIEEFIPLDFTDNETVFARAMEAIEDDASRFDGLTSFYEEAIPLVASMAAALGLDSNPVDACETARNKRKPRQVMAEVGLPVPTYRSITSRGQMNEACKHVGFPAIIKPVYGVMSMGVHRVDSAGEAHKAYDNIIGPMKTEDDSIWALGKELVFEEYYDGEEFDIDILLSEGKCVYSNVLDNWQCMAPFSQEIGMNSPTLYPRSRRKELIKLSANTTLAFGFRSGVFHVECRYTSRGPRMVEVNTRMGNSAVRDSNLTAWGVDLVEDHAMTALRIPIAPVVPEKPMKFMAETCLNAPFSGVVENETWLDNGKKYPEVTRLEYKKKKGESVMGADGDMPDWLAEITVVFSVSQEHALGIISDDCLRNDSGLGLFPLPVCSRLGLNIGCFRQEEKIPSVNFEVPNRSQLG